MHIHDVTIYKPAGIELARVPGAEKLRVRLVKEEGNAQVNQAPEPFTDSGQAEGVDGVNF